MTKQGGKRPGAGRPPGETGTARVKASISLPASLANRLKEAESDLGLSKSRIIEQSLEKYMDEIMPNAIDIPAVKLAAIGIRDKDQPAFLEECRKSFTDPAPVKAAMRCYQEVKGSHRRIALGAMDQGVSLDDLNKAIDLIAKYTIADINRYWRGGDFWLVADTDPHLEDFMKADALHKQGKA